MWALGNMFMYCALDRLGQAVAVSSAQANILVSGCWGIFYYGEVRSPVYRGYWMLGAFVTLMGVACLAAGT